MLLSLRSNPNFNPCPVLLWPPRGLKEPQPWSKHFVSKVRGAGETVTDWALASPRKKCRCRGYTNPEQHHAIPGWKCQVCWPHFRKSTRPKGNHSHPFDSAQSGRSLLSEAEVTCSCGLGKQMRLSPYALWEFYFNSKCSCFLSPWQFHFHGLLLAM